MTGTLRRVVASSLVVALLAATATAAADPHTWAAPAGEPSKSAIAEAQALYIAGNRAVEQGRWSDALADFERSYALSGVPAALYNVATTLRALGRHVESRDAFAQLLAKHASKLDPAVRAEAEKLLAEEKARIAAIVLADLPSKSEGLKITLDGKAAKDPGDRPLAVEVDPGKHAVRVEEPKSKPFTWEGTLGDGEKKTVTVQLAPLPKAPPPAPAKPESSGSIWSSPIFWTVVGVVVVGGAATGGYLYHQSKQLDPGSGNVVKL